MKYETCIIFAAISCVFALYARSGRKSRVSFVCRDRRAGGATRKTRRVTKFLKSKFSLLELPCRSSLLATWPRRDDYQIAAMPETTTPIYTALNVPTVTAYPSTTCLQWSPDGQAYLTTKSAVYIMVCLLQAIRSRSLHASMLRRLTTESTSMPGPP